MTTLSVVVDPNSLSNADVRKTTPCFGLAFSMRDWVCVKQCLVRDRCVKLLGSETVPALEAQAGAALSDDDIGAAQDSNPESIRLARLVASGVAQVTDYLPPATAPGVAPNVSAELWTPDMVTAPAKAAQKGKKPAKNSGPAVQNPLATSPEPVAEQVAQPAQPTSTPAAEPAASPEDPVKKKGKQQKPVKKAAPQKKAAKKVAAKAPAKKTPQKKAKPPKIAKAAPTKAKADVAQPGKKKKPVTAVAAPPEAVPEVEVAPIAAPAPKAKKSKVKAPPTSAELANRERARSPLIAALKIGQKLVKEYKDQTYEAVVQQDGYVCGDTLYPTLYALTGQITGQKEYPRQFDPGGKRKGGTRKMNNWSALKFWGLKSKKV